MRKPKILFLVSGMNVPSTRFRILEQLPRLREYMSISLSPCRPPKDLTHFDFRFGGRPFGFLLFLGKLVSRLTAMARGPFHDLVYLERELLVSCSPLLEKWAMGLCAKSIFDFDDAIYLRHPEAIAAICRRATRVIAGNEHLAAWARAHTDRVSVVPTPVDTDRCAPGKRDAGTVVWTGSTDNLRYLKAIRDRIKRPLRVVCNTKPDFPCEYVPWSPVTEVEAVRSASVGIMPLPDDEWARGKCGLKLIQYMACGLPVVASPVGVNAKIVRHGENGFLASTADEWQGALAQLIADPQLRARMGAAGRALVTKEYSLNAQVPRVAETLRTAAA